MAGRCSLSGDQKDEILKLAKRMEINPCSREDMAWFYNHLTRTLGMVGINFKRLIFFLSIKIRKKEVRKERDGRGKHSTGGVVVVLMRRRYQRFGVK